MEKIICAAIHYDDGGAYVHQPNNIASGFVICGHRHHNCITTYNLTHMSVSFEGGKVVQGFLTDGNHFVTREKALEIAKEAGQLKYPDEVRGGRLFSECLY
jgi:hypothetical protein